MKRVCYNLVKRRYSQVVRPWIANPLPPVRIWVPPNYVFTILLFLIVRPNIMRLQNTQDRECGEIGRHDGLKIRCLVIGVRVQVPPFPYKQI